MDLRLVRLGGGLFELVLFEQGCALWRPPGSGVGLTRRSREPREHVCIDSCRVIFAEQRHRVRVDATCGRCK